MSSTTRLGLLKPAPSDTVDVTAQLDNNYDLIDNAVGYLVCTSSTRPSSPFSGQGIYETDTRRRWLWDGTVWREASPLVSVLGSPFTVTSQTTLQTVTGFNLPVAASTTYTLDALFAYSSATAADAQIGLTLPAGASMLLAGRGLPTSATATAGTVETTAITSGAVQLGAAGVGTVCTAAAAGVITVGATAGTVQVTFAQITSTASNTVLAANSWLRLQRV